MQTLKIANFNSNNILEKTSLAADAAVGTSFTVDNNQNFIADSYFIIGRLGSEVSELLTVESTTDTTGVTSTSSSVRVHSRGEVVTKLFGNQIRVYRAANVNGTLPADDSFALVTDGTISIDIDQAQTEFTDPDGSSDYWYKYTYRNQVASTETNLADSIGVRGGGYGNYTSIESIRIKAGLKENRWITDATIDEKRQAAQSIINSKLTGLYTVPFTSPINPLIAEITRLMAAGFLLTDDYGPMTKLNTSEGQQMIDRANLLLNQLNTKELELTGVDGSSTAITTNSGFQMWPNGDTATTATEYGGGARMFRVDDRY